MRSRSESPQISSVSRLLWATVATPFRRQTYRNLLYLLLAVPLGFWYIGFLIGGLSLGITLTVLLIGIPLLLFVLGTSHVFATIERVLARRLLAVEIATPDRAFLEADSELERLRSLVFGLETYMAVCFLATKFVVAVITLVLVSTLLAPAIALVLAPLYYTRSDVQAGVITGETQLHLTPLELPWHELFVGVELAMTVIEWGVTSRPQALAISAVGLVFIVVFFAVVNTFARLLGQFSRVFLGPFGHSSLDGG